MKKIYILICLLVTVSTVSAQFQRRGGSNRNRVSQPISQSEPTEGEIKRQKELAEERRQEYIANFISTLEADEFQKQIIKQTINSFYDKSIVFSKQQFTTSEEQKEVYEAFKKDHFAELKTLISESDSGKLDDLLNGKFKELDVKKEKRRKKRKRKKN